jgi:hypothetical protein
MIRCYPRRESKDWGEEMYFFRFLVRPVRENNEYGTVAGAYANCWINLDNLRKAKRKAQQYLSEWLWVIEETDEILLTQFEDTKGSKREQRYYQEATEKGVCVVLHKWPSTQTRKARTKK